ncbi:MAG: ferrous iron transport protein B [Planctomycetes bacterium]|nr:ferrous iron transport protein B [Planctomycetota bacterium]
MSATAPPARRRVVLVGRANSGKTSLLMHLTGSLQRPVNFPGTSVEAIESTVRVGDTDLQVVDLPGVASLKPHSKDEQVAIEHLRDPATRPDLLCFVLDAQKLAIELQLLQQLRELGLPIVVAVTKTDVARAEGFPIDAGKLERAVGLPLVVVDGASGDGCVTLRERLASAPLDPVVGGPPSDVGEHARAARAEQRTLARSRTDRLDRLLLHPVVGPLVLVGVVLLMFQLVFTVADPFMGWIELAQEWVSAGAEAITPDGALRSFVVDGIINGVGSSLIFVPQIALLIAFVTIIEATGYMARAVFLLDRVLRGVGLSGKSFIPLTSSFACAIPGIAATRILGDERDRLATIAVAPLMSCSARLPVYVMLLAAFFPSHQAGLMLFAMYAVGIVAAVLVALVLRRTALKGGGSMLAMELPVYQRPRLKLVGMHTWFAVKGFLKTAGTVIFFATIVVWALAYFPRSDEIAQRFERERAAVEAVGGADVGQRLSDIDAREAAANLEHSYLASMGRAVQPVFAPAGFDWRMTVGVLAAFPARELVIPTLGTLYSLGEVEADPDDPDLRLQDALRTAKGPDGEPSMNGLIAIAVMVFFALCSQCAATLAAIRRETHSWRWPVFVFSYMTALAWLAAVAIYQFGRLLGFGS